MNERTIRVDFSRTQAPHESTPGFYNGKPTDEIRRERRDRYGGDRDRRRGGDRDRRGGGDRDRRRVDRFDPDRHYVPRRSDSRDRGSDSRDGKSDSYRRNDRSRSRSRSIDRSRDYNREYRPSRRSLSPRN